MVFLSGMPRIKFAKSPFYPSPGMKKTYYCEYPCLAARSEMLGRFVLAPHPLSPSPRDASPARCLTVEILRVDSDKFSGDRLGEHWFSICARVQAVQQRQLDPFKGTGVVCNADMRIAGVRKFCKLDETRDSLIRAAMTQSNLSARAYHRIMNLAMTIAGE